ncbi:hypothetical protein PW5551_01485 [Petrotoga sp. 9PW.55.5.1]|jgi:tripartite-type tricarboxylate transporter receptor subunit TctC|uniref:hypothetical protein n=1 Tax=Petrotoga sp. 9PW.55.5.1 TaxID=1308979 RepID=UPI000DC5FBFE|nr:hypothetical protein [Petrotoga sp. 9PW.55.5.1]RAO99733.1 hypothetical protein PW5551_01485 [Petrotoga sp. 9PW.55.5.1]
MSSMSSNPIGPAFNVNSMNVNKMDVRDATEAFVSDIFAKILNSAQDSELFKENKLIPESNTEKWFKEWINVEYANMLTQKSLTPLVDQIISSFPPQR